MKKTFIALSLLSGSLMAQAGGLLTNTNQHISFVRMMARGASHEIDAVYSNPAGVAWMDQGWTLCPCIGKRILNHWTPRGVLTMRY